MEPDLKDTIKKLEEAKNRQEKIERIIILLSGLLIIIIFSIIGINIYTDKEETVSEPEVTIVSKEIKKTEPTLTTETKPAAPTQSAEVIPPITKKEQAIQSSEEKVETKKSQDTKKTSVKTEKTKENRKSPETKKTDKRVEKPSFAHGFYIQVGAFSSKKKAEKLVKNLQIKNVFIRKEGELYKVMIGNFKNKKEAYDFMKAKNIKGFIRKI